MLEVKDGKMSDSNYLDIEGPIYIDLITIKIKNIVSVNFSGVARRKNIWTITNNCIICYNIKNFINCINS